MAALLRRPRLALADRGRILVATASTWVLIGVIIEAPVVTALGSLPLVALCALFTQAQVARRMLAETRVTAARRGPTRDGSAPAPLTAGSPPLRTVVDRPLQLSVSLHPPAGLTPQRLTVAAGVTAPLEATASERPDGAFDLALRSRRVGHHWLLGVQLTARVTGGLFEVRAWIPVPLAVEVLPRHFPHRNETHLRATRAARQEHSAAAHRRRPGLGLEIRELRDFQAGDPFKHIAWSASARRGKLISREFESDLALSTWILVDCSPSMTWGEPGRARIDYAIETAHDLASVLLDRRDRVGLVVHDDRVRLVVPSGAGRAQLSRVITTLTEIPHLVHEDRTELTDRELIDRVARWFVAQRRRSFTLPEGLVQTASPRLSPFDEARLVEAAQEVLQELTHGAGRPPLVAHDGYAPDYQRSILRAFCRHVGVPLPVDPTPRPGGQARGLEAAVERVMAARGGPHTLVAISDLFTADDHDALRRVALASRRRHHSLIVLCPDQQTFDLDGDGAEGDALQRAVLAVERASIEERLAVARAILKPAGTAFLSVGPDDALPRVLTRLRHGA